MIVRMSTHELEVSILAAPLAQMDRRALSQAWYTALRLAPNAQGGSSRTLPAQTRSVSSVTHRFADACELRGGVKPSWAPATRSLARRVATASDESCQIARPARRDTLAERIERAFAGVPQPAKRATFSLGRGNARVHIVLQTIGERPTLLALCRPEVRSIVGRALAQARLALARRGIGIDLRALGELEYQSCS